jgi:hypothetical protein
VCFACQDGDHVCSGSIQPLLRPTGIIFRLPAVTCIDFCYSTFDNVHLLVHSVKEQQTHILSNSKNMPFWANKKDSAPEQKPQQSTNSWQSLPTGASTNDDSGFLHPESTLASNRGLIESEWSKERSNQQLELEDVYNDQLGCCSKVGMYTVETLHAIDVSIGLALVIYGSLLFTQFETPAMAAALFCVILGTIHLATSLAGIFSFVVAACSRCGLVISAYIAPYYVIVYITIVIALIVDSKGFLKYLDDHKDQMFLGQDAATNFKRMLPLLYTVLIVLGLLESLR